MQAHASAPTQSQAAQDEVTAMCRQCGHVKPQNLFVRNKTYCKDCRNAADRARSERGKGTQVSMCMPFGIFVFVVCRSVGSLSGIGIYVFAGAAKGQHDMS